MIKVILQLTDTSSNAIIWDRDTYQEISSLSQCKSDASNIFYGTLASKGTLKIVDKNNAILNKIKSGTLSISKLPITLIINDKVAQVHITKNTPSYNTSNKTFVFDLGNVLDYLDNEYNGYENDSVWTANSSGITLAVLLDSITTDANISVTTSNYVTDLLEDIIVRYPYLEKSTYRQALTKICQCAMLQIFIKDNGTIYLDTARPSNLNNKTPISIPAKCQFSTFSRKLIADNKYDKVKITEHNVNIVEETLLSYKHATLLEQTLGRTSHTENISASNYLESTQTILNANVSKGDIRTAYVSCNATSAQTPYTQSGTVRKTSSTSSVSRNATIITQADAVILNVDKSGATKFNRISFTTPSNIDQGYGAEYEIVLNGTRIAYAVCTSNQYINLTDVAITESGYYYLYIYGYDYRGRKTKYVAESVSAVFTYAETTYQISDATVQLGGQEVTGVSYAVSVSGSCNSVSVEYNSSGGYYNLVGTFGDGVGEGTVTFTYYSLNDITHQDGSITLPSGAIDISVTTMAYSGIITGATVTNSGLTYTITPTEYNEYAGGTTGTATATITYYIPVITIDTKTLPSNSLYISQGLISYTGACTSANITINNNVATLTPTAYSFNNYATGTCSCTITYYFRYETVGSTTLGTNDTVDSALLVGNGSYRLTLNSWSGDFTAGASGISVNIPASAGAGTLQMVCLSTSDVTTQTYNAILYLTITTTGISYLYTIPTASNTTNIKYASNEETYRMIWSYDLYLNKDISDYDINDLVFSFTYKYRYGNFAGANMQVDNTGDTSSGYTSGKVEVQFAGNNVTKALINMPNYSTPALSVTIYKANDSNGILYYNVAIECYKRNNQYNFSIAIIDMQVDITIRKNYIRENLNNTAYGSGDNVITLESNELIQKDTTLNGTAISQILANRIISDYANGITSGEITICINDYYYTNGNIAKSKANGDIIEVGDIVRIDKDNLGNSAAIYENNVPMLWIVTSRKIRKTGYPYLDLELMEIK